MGIDSVFHAKRQSPSGMSQAVRVFDRNCGGSSAIRV